MGDATQEIQTRLQHLRSLPPNPMREREIKALERTLLQAPSSTNRRKSASRKESPVRVSRPEPIPEPEKPLRRVEKDGTRRRVIIRSPRPEPRSDDQETEADRRALEDAKRNIRALREGSHFGMS